MTDGTCGACGTPTPVNALYDLNDKSYCAACAQRAVEIAKSAGQPTNVIPLANKLLCARCNSSLSSGTPFTQVGNLRFCESCGAMIKDWKYPQWLRLSFVGLLLLLVVALANGAKYFAAGRSLYRGERLLEESKYAEALPELQKTLRIAPNSDKAALLATKAALLSSHPEIAAQALQNHKNGYFDDAKDPQFQEVNLLWKRATKAFDEMEQASKLQAEDGREVEAARLVHAAAADYPQYPDIQLAENYFDGGVAFAQKNYAQLLALAEKNWTAAPTAGNALFMVSALDCNYAATGESQYRSRSEEMFQRALTMAKGDKQALDAIAEFTDRHKYRLETRNIITKKEYDLRFRSHQAAGKK